MKKIGLFAGGLKMKKTKLKPYVHKVKGAKNYALYDLLKGNFYALTPEGDIEELKQSLKDAGLTFEPGGIVPFKTEIDLSSVKDTVNIRQLQIRLNGKDEDNCWSRKKISQEKRFISDKTLHHLKNEIENIPIKKIYLEAEIEEPGKIEFILNEFPFEEMEIFVETGINPQKQEQYKKICEHREKKIYISADGKKKLKELKVDIYEFFYNQHFNPCLGHQIAVDCQGEVKPCLWSKFDLGKIGQDKILDMIISGSFDEYWKLTKDKIGVCKDCEFRYACPDCRESKTYTGKENFNAVKPGYCNYDPYSGDLCQAPT
jgi:radical SAM protein with 4Fe4S-binding SPASM domain